MIAPGTNATAVDPSSGEEWAEVSQADSLPYIPDDTICFWGGYGGSMIIVDVDRRMTVSYMMNKMAAGIVGNPTSGSLISAAYAAVA